MSDPEISRLKSDVAALKQRSDNQGKRIDELAARLTELSDEIRPLFAADSRRMAQSGDQATATNVAAKRGLYELQKRVMAMEKRRRGA